MEISIPQGLKISGACPDFSKGFLSYISGNIWHVWTWRNISFRGDPAIMSAGRAAARIGADKGRGGIGSAVRTLPLPSSFPDISFESHRVGAMPDHTVVMLYLSVLVLFPYTPKRTD